MGGGIKINVIGKTESSAYIDMTLETLERFGVGVMYNDGNYSEFYIEVAKFVQAYRTIVTNPNEFLTEIHAPTIDEKNEKLMN